MVNSLPWKYLNPRALDINVLADPAGLAATVDFIIHLHPSVRCGEGLFSDRKQSSVPFLLKSVKISQALIQVLNEVSWLMESERLR